MKKLLFFSLMIISATAFSQQPAVSFKESKHSFGKIKQKVPATFTFTFTNTGAKPAVIEFANASCGCTTPVYTKEPVPKGKTGTVKVTYNAEALGTFTKDVTVKFLDAQQPVVLTISGEVVAPAKGK